MLYGEYIMNIRKRVEMACARSGLKLTDLAKKVGLTPQAMGKSLDKNQSTYKRLDDISEVLGVPADWIRNGGTPPWEKNRLAETINEYEANITANATITADELYEELQALKIEFIMLAGVHLDLVSRCKAKGMDVSEDRVEDVLAVLERLKK